MSLLKDIYRGEYYPSETVVPTTQEYADCRNTLAHIEKELTRALGTGNAGILSDYIEAYANVMDLVNYEFFLEGIRLGVSLQQEIGDI